MRISALLALAALGAISVASFHGFNQFINDKSEGMEFLQRYTASKGAFHLTGVGAIDSFVSLFVYMFRDHVLINPIQWWIFAEWTAVFASLSWLNVEFTRTQMRFVPLYFFLWNFAGLAPFLALIMVYYVIAKELQSTFFLTSLRR